MGVGLFIAFNNGGLDASTEAACRDDCRRNYSGLGIAVIHE
jgi:hypothetical protein